MFRLAHLSDLHLGPLPDVSYRELASKRITGYVNWQRNRRQQMKGGVIEALAEDMRAHAPDHIVLTGDLVNLALDAEIEAARLWLEEFGKPDDVSVVPGNHDAYVPGAFDKVCKAWAGYMTGDGAPPPSGRRSFPFLRERGPAAFLGATSARASAPFMASGYFREEQGRRLASQLDQAARDGKFRIVLIHHPPVRGATPPHKRLFGITRFQRIVREHGAELVLHGHTHLPTTHWIEGRKGARVPVVGVAAAGEGHGVTRPLAQYNLFEISGEPGAWGLRLMRRGLTGAGSGVHEIADHMLAGHPESAATKG